MNRLRYTRPIKTAAAILEGLLFGVIIVCFLYLYHYYTDGYTLNEVGVPFENTHTFMRQASHDVCTQIVDISEFNPFLRNGSWSDRLWLDITTGEISSTTNPAALDTNYKLSDLKIFCESGDCSEMRAYLGSSWTSPWDKSASVIYNVDRLEALEAMKKLETIRPKSGETLASYAENPERAGEDTLWELYGDLVGQSQRVWEAWVKYEEYGGTSLPSNVLYFVREQISGQCYTNLGSDNYESALEEVSSQTKQNDAIRLIYAGRRRGAVAVPENGGDAFTKAALDYFSTFSFRSNNEEVVLACDTAFTAGDGVKFEKDELEARAPIALRSVIWGSISAILLLALLVYSSVATGRSPKTQGLAFTWMDRAVHTEIAALLYVGAAVLWLAAMREVYLYPEWRFDWYLGMGVVNTVLYWLFLAGFLSLLRRIKGKILWKNSICGAIVRLVRRASGSLGMTTKVAISFAALVLVNICCGYRLCDSWGGRRWGTLLLVLLLDGVALLWLLRDALDRKSLKVGLRRIAEGDLDYKIDQESLKGDNRAMAEAVNEMGDGLKAAVDARVKNERLKAALITNVSHDIKTPLTSIINYVDLLKREKLDNEKAVGYLEVLERKSWRLKQLTEDLVEASKISSGNIELHMERVDMAQAVKQAVGEYEEALEGRHLEVILEMDEEQALIEADGRQLWRVFENLLQNIKKYALPGTRVYIHMQCAGREAVATFKNISESRLNLEADELTERFVRGDASRGGEGSGLGLSIAKNLTELMKGRLDIHLDGDLFKVSVSFPKKENPLNTGIKEP